MIASFMRKTRVNRKSLTRACVATVMLASIGGCSTISDWFADEEELEIRRLKPIEMQFEPQIVWQTDLGEGVDDYFSTLRPVYAYDKLYVAERHGVVAALNPENGERIWETNFAIFPDDGIWDSIARLWRSGASAKVSALNVGYNRVFIGTEDGKLMALNAESGELDWEVSLNGEVLAPPAMDEGILVVNTGAGTLFGLDITTGETLWETETDVPPLTLRGISAPAAGNGGALVGTPTGKLQVNIINSGLMAWEAAITAPAGATELERIVDVDTSPVIVGGTIYVVSYNGTLASVEMRSGRVVWKREYGAYRNISVQGNKLFVVDNNAYVYALDRRNGVELWSQNSLRGRLLTSAEPFDEYVVVGDNWGYMHFIEQETGKIVSRIEVGGDDEDEALFSAPLKVNDMIIATTRDGEVAAVKLPKP